MAFPSLVGPPGTPGGPGTYVPNYATLRLINATVWPAGYIAWVLGASTIGDGGEGLFEYRPVAANPDNDGTIIEPGNSIGRWFRLYSSPVNVRWFKAKGDGITNDSAAFSNAIGTFGTEGGMLWVPRGQYLTNTTITASNVIVQGVRSNNFNSVSDTYIGPFNPALAPITVGGDVAGQRTAGVVLKNLYLYGANVGLTGLELTGGCYEFTMDECAVSGFEIGINIEQGVNAATTLLNFNDCKFSSRPNGIAIATDRVVRIFNNGAQFLTGLYFMGCRMSGATEGYVLENDGCEVHLDDVYVDAEGSHCIKMSNTHATPLLRLNLTTLDSTSGDAASIVMHANTNPSINLSVTGSSMQYIKLLNGTLVEWAGDLVGYAPVLTFPMVRGSQSWIDTDHDDPNSFSQSLAIGGNAAAIVTADAGTERFSGNVKLNDGDRVVFTSTVSVPTNVLPAPFAYYVVNTVVVNSASRNFQIATSRGGAAVNLGSAGAGIITATFVLAVRTYNTNGVLHIEAKEGLKLQSDNAGIFELVGQVVDGSSTLRLTDQLNNKSGDVARFNNDNTYIGKMGPTGDMYFVRRDDTNVGGIRGAVGTMWALELKAGNSNVNQACAVMEAASTTRGFLPPRMTTGERDLIAGPVAGLVIYNTTTSVLNFYNGAVWGPV